MDHRVSKDMISSGMTPSGEKTQADLGKTQYGSAPSPNRLMDAYHSMYQNQKEETVDEGMVGDTIKKVGQVGKKIKSKVSDMTDQAGKEQRRAIARTTLERENSKESIDLLAAYRAVYEHHQKDENGNTIPHEDDVKEGKIPAGLQAYLDKKKGKKKDDEGDDKKEGKKKAKKDVKEGAGLYANIHAKRKRGGKMRKKGAKGAPSSQDFANAAKTAKEDFEKYDLVYDHFISEGFSEEETYERMSNLTEEQLDEFLKALAQAGMRGAERLGKATRGGAARAAYQGAMTDPKFKKLEKVQGPRPNHASQVLDDLRTRRKQQTDNLRGRLDKAVTQLRSKEGLKFGGDQKSQASTTTKTDPKKKPSPEQKATRKEITDKMKKPTPFTPGVGYVASQSIRRKNKEVMQDSFDLISNELIKEGYSEKEAYKIMSNLTEDQIEELNEAIVTGSLALLGGLGKLLGGAKAATVAAKAATGAKLAAGSAKLAAGGAKLASAGKKVMTGTKDLANKAMTKVKNISKPSGNTTGPKITSSGGNVVQGGDDKPKNNILSTDNLVKAQIAGSMLGGGGGGQQKQRSGQRQATGYTQYNSADLFDIVKGQLLDEGLSEEEIRDIMLELTPEEIMSEMAVNPKIAAMDAKNRADMIARAKAKQVPQDIRDKAKKQYKAGTPRENPNDPYTKQDAKDIRDYHSKNN